MKYDWDELETEEDFEEALDSIHLHVRTFADYEDYESDLIFVENVHEHCPELAKKFSERIRKIKIELKSLQKEWDKQLKDDWDRIEKLAEYFEKKKTSIALPKWVLEWDTCLFDEAAKMYEECLEYDKWEKEFMPKAIKFVLKHKGIPRDLSKFSKDEIWTYSSLLDKRKSTLLKMLDKYQNTETNSDFKPFYIASELTATERNKLIKEFGYRSVPFMNIETGKTGKNLIIKNNSKKESDYHFCMKNLFSKQFKGCFEYEVDGQRVDVVFIKGKRKLALEIETGSNKDLQIEKKIELLRNRFDQFLIVCKREHKKKYRQFVDASHIVTMTEATAAIKKFRGIN